MLAPRRALAALPLSLVLVAAADVEVVTDPQFPYDCGETSISHFPRIHTASNPDLAAADGVDDHTDIDDHKWMVTGPIEEEITCPDCSSEASDAFCEPNVTLDAETEIGHATAGGGFVWFFGTVEIEQGCTLCPPL